jgi:hypothetical protein
MAFGFNFGQSKQRQDSYSGLRGTPYFNQFAGNFAGVGNALSKQTLGYANSPVNMFQGQTGEQISNTNPLTGLPMAFNNNLTSFGNSMFANASAGGSFRGQNSPENTQGVVGSAMTNMGATLLPYITDWQKYVTGLPEELKKSKLGMYQSTLGSMAPGLGAESHGSGSSLNLSGSVSGKGSPFG